jgi:predicted HTH domain antitoxin
MSDTVTVSMKLPKAEIGRIETAAKALGFDRETFLKMALRQGSTDVLIEQATTAYRRGAISLSRAAEIAGISLHEMLAKMDRYGLEFNYGIDDLEKDLHS